MKTRKFIIIAAIISLMPAFAAAQNYGSRILGPEGAKMEMGFGILNWFNGESSKNKTVAPAKKNNSDAKFTNGKLKVLSDVLTSLKEDADAQTQAKKNKSADSARITTPADVVAMRLARERQAELSKKYNAAKNYKKFLEEEKAKVPAEQQARWTEMAKNKRFGDLITEIKSFKDTDKFNYDNARYFILDAVVKVDGKGIVSFGSLDIAQTIIRTTDITSYAYKEAKKVERSVYNSGKAL